MRTTVLLAALLAAPLSIVAIEEDVVVWTTIIEWVGPGGAPIAAPSGNAGSQAVGYNADNGRVKEHNNNPVPAHTKAAVATSSAAAVVNEKVALHNDGGGRPGNQANQQQEQNTVPVVTSSVAPSSSVVSTAPSSAPSSEGSGGGGGGFQLGTCTGSGMNIFWTGDEVDYSVMIDNGPDIASTGTTTGCLNLGDFHSQVYVGGVHHTMFEGNWGADIQYFDVSYIPGFSVPMVCNSPTGKMTGCSIDLHSHGSPCPQSDGDKLCTNPVGAFGNKDPGGYLGEMAADPWCGTCSAPDPFFQPCAGSAYAFPYDDDAVATAGPGDTITCCIGTSCGSTGREGRTKGGNPQPTRQGAPCALCPSQYSKRGLEDVLADTPAMTPSLLPRKHKRNQHQHRHADVHDAKRHR